MKTLRIIIAILVIFIGVFGVLCGGTFAGVMSLIELGGSNQEYLSFVVIIPIGVISLFISYLIVKYGIRWIKRIKNSYEES